jgi:hypothetical protein
MDMKAVPNHWRQTASFESAKVLEIPDGAARLVQVQSGAVDIAELDPVLAGEADAAGLNVLPIKDIGNAFVILGGMYDPSIKAVPDDPDRVFVNDDKSPWIQTASPEKGLAIREAMSLAIDRQLILDQILQGHGSLATGPLIQYNAKSGPQRRILVVAGVQPRTREAEARRRRLSRWFPGRNLRVPRGEVDTFSNRPGDRWNVERPRARRQGNTGGRRTSSTSGSTTPTRQGWLGSSTPDGLPNPPRR